MKVSAPLLLPLLRSRTQGDIFARLFLNPDRELSISEVAEQVGASVSTVGREVNRLEAAGLVTTLKRGHSRLIQVDQDNAIFSPLAELMALTFGVVPVLEAALDSVDGIEEAFIFGSWAARYEDQAGPVPGDIDVMVIGSADRDLLYDVGTEAGKKLRREVNIRRMTRDVWLGSENDSFRATVQSRPITHLTQRTSG